MCYNAFYDKIKTVLAKGMNENMISVRNIFISFLIIVAVLFSTECLLSSKNKKDEEFYFESEENEKIMLLQFEHSTIDKFFTSATNVYNATQWYSTLDFKPELIKHTYPLIDMNTNKNNDDAFNIVVIGDSFVWGAYSLNRNELFWRLLENDFRSEGKNINVYGIGTTGANAYEELSWLTDSSLIEDLDPDFVIFGYVYNDSDDSVIIYSNEVNWREELPLLSSIENFFPNIYSNLIERISAKTMYTNKYSNSDYVDYDCAPPVLKGRFYEKYKEDFVKKLDDFATTVDFPIAVVTLPTIPNNMLLESLYEPLEELYFNCKNISYYNSVESFNKFSAFKHSKNYSVNIADFHPGSATNRFYADYIKDFLEKDFSHLIESIPDGFENSNNITINEYLPYRISLVKKSEDKNSTEYELLYPSKSEEYKVVGVEVKPYFLINPLGKEHIKLSFSEPVDISEIEISGEYNSVELYNTCVNPRLNYDDHSIYEMKNLTNNTFALKKSKDVTSILISADFDENANRKISISFKK